MHIDIQAKGVKLTEALRAQAEGRLRFALGSASGRVRNVIVRLADEDGPRGGVDKRCTIQVNVAGAAPVIIEHQEADLRLAIDRAADRMGRAVSRRLRKISGGRPNGSYSGIGCDHPESRGR